jgi:SAM-dependent methyltransferase
MFVMDMLEHVSDDALFVRALARIAIPGGRAVFTVPAHPRLFSAHDEFLGHRRRYTRARLRSVLDAAGFRIDELFAFFLAPLLARGVMVALHRLRLPRSAAHGVGNWPMGEQHIVTRALTGILRADFAVNRRMGRACGCSAGLSLCALCTATSDGIEPGQAPKALP